MKKLISVAILSLYLISATELYQLLKMPVLIEHFIEHKKENKKTTLISFFQMHYFNGDVKDADYEQDMKLPFKSHSESGHSTVLALIPQKTVIVKRLYIEPHTFLIYEDMFLTSSHLSGIWQPPKFS